MPPWVAATALDVRLKSVGPVVVDQSVLNLELVPDVRVTGTVGRPALDGQVTIQDAGRIRVGGRSYRLTESRLVFSPAAGLYRWTVSYAGDDNNEPANTACGAANQASTVGKASPTLAGVATSAVVVGSSITDGVTLSSGFEASGQLVFRAYGPGDATCSTTPKYEATVAVDGNATNAVESRSRAPTMGRWSMRASLYSRVNGRMILSPGTP